MIPSFTSDLNVQLQTKRVLSRNGIYNTYQLRQYTANELLAMRGLGMKTVGHITGELAKRGFKLRQDPEALSRKRLPQGNECQAEAVSQVHK